MDEAIYGMLCMVLWREIWLLYKRYLSRKEDKMWTSVKNFIKSRIVKKERRYRLPVSEIKDITINPSDIKKDKTEYHEQHFAKFNN